MSAQRCVAAMAAALSFAFTLPQPALADDDSPMGQGHASINVRSDVRMAFRGTHGTPRARLEKLGALVTGRMDGVRACYRKLVAKRPTTVGAFQVTIGLSKGEADRFSVEEKGGSDSELKACVMRVLTKGGYRTVERPAAGVLTLEFSNTRAEGEAELTKLKAESDDIPVSVDADGLAHASWANNDGKVAFEVKASGPHGQEVAAVAVRGLRDAYATFLDCRRKNDKDGLSPAGTIDVQLRLARRGGRASMKLKACSVPHKRAPRCNERAFRRARFGPAPPGARASVRISYLP